MRKSWKSIIAMCIVTAMAVTILAGCGSSGNAAQSGASGAAASNNANTASSDVITLKFGCCALPGDVAYDGAEYWTNLVNERSGGHLNVELYGSGVLGSDKDTTEACQSGGLALSTCGTTNLSSFCNAFSALELPYVVSSDNKEAYYDAVDNGELGEYFTEELAKVGLVAIMYGDGGWRRWHTVEDVPITCAADFKNIKLRTTSSEVDNALVQALGASPLSLGITDVYTALSQGTVDGLGVPYLTIVSNGWQEITTNTFVTDYNYYMHVIVMNQAQWNALSAEDQQLLRDCAAEAVQWDREKYWADDANYEKTMQDAGCTFYYASEDDTAELKEIGQKVWDQMASSTDAHALELIQATQS